MNCISEEASFHNGSAARPTTLHSDSTVTLVDQMTPNSTPNPSPNSPKYHHKSSLKRNISYGNIPSTDKTEARVLVIYTGGTIGMMRNEKNGEQVKKLRLCYLGHASCYQGDSGGPKACAECNSGEMNSLISVYSV